MSVALDRRVERDALPTLERELLLSLGILVGAALSVAVIAALIAQLVAPTYAVVLLALLIVADVGVVFLFGRYLIRRLVMQPMDRLTDAAEALAQGDLRCRAPRAETREFTTLADKFNSMTERLLDAQGQLVRAEKMAGIGRLAAGIAHEVGNPLAALGTYIEVLARRGADPEVVSAIRRETERIDRIVSGLLAYARPKAEEMGEVDVGALLRNAVDLLGRQGTLKGIEVALETEPELPLIRAKAHLLEQVVVNLLLNAATAAEGGRITVGAARWRYVARARDEMRRSDEQVGAPGDGPEGRVSGSHARPWRPELADGTAGVLFWVADSGPGVPEPDRERVFDPFYTTKDPGQGTGLGLAVAQRSVHEFGGVIWVDDAREGGAAFKVFLPEAAASSVARGGDSPARQEHE